MQQNERFRIPFSNQPVHCLIVDLTGPVTPEALFATWEGLTDFFSIVCGMRSGKNRIPYFCLLTISPYVEICFPLQRLTSLSYGKLENAIHKAEKLSTNLPSVKSYQNAFKDSIIQFNKISNSANPLTKLHLTLLTCHAPQVTRSKIIEALNAISDFKFAQIDAFCFQSSTPIDASLSDIDNFDDVINVDVIETAAWSVEALLRNWLHDSNKSTEHLHLQFGENPDSMVIKCDVSERVVDVTELPFADQLCISTGCFDDMTSSASGGYLRTTFRSSNGVAITKLRVVKRVAVEGICESIIFGVCGILTATSCWRIEWEALEANQNRFIALANALSASQQALVCENITMATGPRGLFVVMATAGSLLVKSIASKELLIQSSVANVFNLEQLPDHVIREVNDVIHELPSDDTFNPLLYDINITSSLREYLVDRNAPPATPQNRVQSSRSRLLSDNNSPRARIRSSTTISYGTPNKRVHFRSLPNK